jgi:hypothetical protein
MFETESAEKQRKKIAERIMHVVCAILVRVKERETIDCGSIPTILYHLKEESSLQKSCHNTSSRRKS